MQLEVWEDLPVEPPYNEPKVLLRLDDYPHSIAFRPHEIMIAQTNGSLRAPYEPKQETVPQDSLRLVTPSPGAWTQ